MPRRAAAFTLTELLVVIGIIVMVVGVSLPAFDAFARSKKLDQAGQVIKGAMNEARRAAITTRVPHRIVFTKTAIRIYRVKRSPDEATYVSQNFPMPGFIEIVPGCDPDAWKQRNDPARQRPPDTFPVVDSKATPPKDEVEARKSEGYIEFRIDGTAHFASPFKPIGPTRIKLAGGAEVSAFEPGIDTETAQPVGLTDDVPLADVVAIQTNLRTKACVVDVIPTTGKSRSQVIKVSR